MDCWEEVHSHQGIQELRSPSQVAVVENAWKSKIPLDTGAEGRGRQREARKKMGSNSMNPQDGFLVCNTGSLGLLPLPLIHRKGKRTVSGKLISGSARAR